jgi:hypothetical protein
VVQDDCSWFSAKELLDHFAKPQTIEGFRFIAVQKLAKQRSLLRGELDQFAEARRHQVEAWEDVETPSVLDAAAAVVDAAKVSTGRALSAAGAGLIRVSDYLTEPAREKEKVADKTDTLDDTPEQRE